MSQKGVNIKATVVEASAVQVADASGKPRTEYIIKYTNPLLGSQSLKILFPTSVVKEKIETLISKVAPASPGAANDCVLQLYVKVVKGKEYPNTLNDILPVDNTPLGEVEFELTNKPKDFGGFKSNSNNNFSKPQESIEIQCCFKQAVQILAHNKEGKEISVNDVRDLTHNLYTLVLSPLIKAAKAAHDSSENAPVDKGK